MPYSRQERVNPGREDPRVRTDPDPVVHTERTNCGSDSYREYRPVLPTVTDDTDEPDAGPVGNESREANRADPSGANSRPDPPGPTDAADVDFADLSLPQRLFVASVQNPTRGVMIVALVAFAFSFYMAFWLAFPRGAALLSTLAVGVGGVIAALYYLFNRVLD